MEQARTHNFFHVLIGAVIIVICVAIAFHYASGGNVGRVIDAGAEETTGAADSLLKESTDTLPAAPVASHITTPKSVRALYMTAWVAGTPSLRDKLIALVEATEANALVIDIKDATGTISYLGQDPVIMEYGTYSNRIPNIRELLEMLHAKGIYVIGRISVFQDPKLTAIHPESAVQKLDGTVWTDRKGLSFMDVQSPAVQDYVERIATEAYALGFDEINLDYVRFPTDGNLKDVRYPVSGTMARTDALRQFFIWVNDTLRVKHGFVVSADVFGLTTTAADDLGIGQTFAVIAPYVDYICPMIYPSHYAKGFNGFDNPAAHPADVVRIANLGAIQKLNDINNATGSALTADMIRPWLQDFDMGATYTAEMVRAQIDETVANGISSWSMWDPRNDYTDEAYQLEQ